MHANLVSPRQWALHGAPRGTSTTLQWPSGARSPWYKIHKHLKPISALPNTPSAQTRTIDYPDMSRSRVHEALRIDFSLRCLRLGHSYTATEHIQPTIPYFLPETKQSEAAISPEAIKQQSKLRTKNDAYTYIFAPDHNARRQLLRTASSAPSSQEAKPGFFYTILQTTSVAVHLPLPLSISGAGTLDRRTCERCALQRRSQIPCTMRAPAPASPAATAVPSRIQQTRGTSMSETRRECLHRPTQLPG